MRAEEVARLRGAFALSYTQETMRLKVLNRLKLNRPIASDYPSSSPELRAWLGVHPIEYSRERPFQRSPGDPGRQPPAPRSELDRMRRFPPGAKYWVTIIEFRKEDVDKIDFSTPSRLRCHHKAREGSGTTPLRRHRRPPTLQRSRRR